MGMYAKYLGWYLLVVTIGLLVWSAFVIVTSRGAADFSFVVLFVPAVGLLLSRRWACRVTVVFGILVGLLVVGLAAGRTVGLLSGLELRLGPIIVENASVAAAWGFAIGVLVLLAIPMAAVQLIQVVSGRPHRQDGENERNG